ncbi:MAG: porin family protein [Salibacteraceae bacterium]
MGENNRNNIVLKNFFIGVILLLSTLFSTAQEEHRFKFGLHVGPSVTWLSFKTDDIQRNGTAVKMNFGLFTDFALKGSNRYFFSTGINMITNGGEFSYVGVENDNGLLYQSSNEVDLTTQYIEIPIALKMRSHEIGYSIFAGYFGFGTGFRINAFQDIKSDYTDGSGKNKIIEEKKINVESDINPVRFALVAGLEWERKITKETYFTVGMNLNYGLSNIYQTKAYELDANDNIDWSKVDANGNSVGNKLKGTNRGVSLHVGVYF